MVERNLEDEAMYLLFKNANPHILDLDGLDCCDKAKQNGLSSKILEFNNCSILKQKTVVKVEITPKTPLRRLKKVSITQVILFLGDEINTTSKKSIKSGITMKSMQ